MSSIACLTYFNLRGPGEYIRLLLVDQKIDFRDERLDIFSLDGKWSEIKESTPFGKLPMLKIDGLEIYETGAILRFLARKYGLNGKNEREASFLDMFCEEVRDLRAKFEKFTFWSPAKQHFINTALPEHLASIESVLLASFPDGPFVLGEQRSYVDYVLFEELDVFHSSFEPILDEFPGLKAFWELMRESPNLSAYYEKRRRDGVPNRVFSTMK